MSLYSGHEPPRQDQQCRVRAQAQNGEQRDRVPAGPESLPQGFIREFIAVATALVAALARRCLGGEELAMALVPTIYRHEKYSRAVNGEERPDGVEFGREDLEDDQREGELSEGRAHVSTFKGALGSADLDELWSCEDDGAGAVQA